MYLPRPLHPLFSNRFLNGILPEKKLTTIKRDFPVSLSFGLHF